MIRFNKKNHYDDEKYIFVYQIITNCYVWLFVKIFSLKKLLNIKIKFKSRIFTIYK